MKEFDLVIIGGGPAGIAAATEAARRGASVALVDENRTLGGKVFGHGNQALSGSIADRMEKRLGDRLFEDLNEVGRRVSFYLDTEVWAIVDHSQVALHSRNGSNQEVRTIKGRKLIISAGAHERAFPFPGWTLPGVFSLGGLNGLVKKGVLPGKRFLIAGSGPLPLVLAHYLIREGAEIAGLVGAASPRELVPSFFSLLGTRSLSRLISGVDYVRSLRAQRIPLYTSHILSQVNGTSEVEQAVIVRIDRSWRPIRGTEKRIKVDTIGYGYGLIPCAEMTQLCGCKHVYDERLGYWRVLLNERMESTIPGVFVAGDVARIKGYSAAIEEGRVAALEACAQLGHLKRNEAEGLIQRSLRRIKRFRRFGEAIDSISAPKSGLLEILTDETIVCRCEEVTLGDARAAAADGAIGVNDLKRRTRLGMGHCQGRFCGQVINELLWKLWGIPREREVFTTRIPIKPVPVQILAGE